MTRLGLVWGYDFAEGRSESLGAPDPIGGFPEPGVVPSGSLLPDRGEGMDAGLRWLHLNMTDQASCRWLEGEERLPTAVRELLLSPDAHPRALVVEGFVACILADFEVEFGQEDTQRFAALRFALGQGMMITARHHPVQAADVVRRRIGAGARPQTPAKALDLLVSSIVEVASVTAVSLNATVQSSEDALLADGWMPDQRVLVGVRRRTVQLHRQLFGIRGVLQRLEEDDELPADLLPTVEKLSQRVASLDGDVVAIQADLRLLREELDLQAAQRTNKNLYVLSILSALLLPATLVTGFFGMNTGGFPWHDSNFGTFFAGCVAAGSSFAVYVWLRGQGFLGSK